MFENKEQFKKMFKEKVNTLTGKSIEEATNSDAYRVLGSLVKERANEKWAETNKQYRNQQVKQAYYFCIEFLIGRLLNNNLLNMGLLKVCDQGLQELGFDLGELEEEEPEAGLGNGGLGRLAACFLDSLASLKLPGHGCGIRYKYGLFKQKIIDGHQVELPDYWLNDGYIWEIRRPEKSVEVHFGGHVETVTKEDGDIDFEHQDYEVVKAVPYDVPIIGYKSENVNTLRLWSAEIAEGMSERYIQSEKDRNKFLEYKRSVESISEFLYPDDYNYEGRLLRLKQQYFLCSAGLQSIFRTFEKYGLPYQEFPHKVALHVNDTHPSLLIPELMRILMDEKGLGWDQAWQITQQTISYTNHTLMSEALETWPIEMMKSLLPRIYMIINEINERFCQRLWDLYPGDFDRISDMAIIAEDKVKMAHLAIVGGHSVNGVAKLHTKIIKEQQMNNFYEVFPEKFNNKTNGITHRRWLIKCNPQLSELITETIGEEWIENPQEIEKIVKYREDNDFQKRIAEIKESNKTQLAEYIKEQTGIIINENSIFDVHAKRLHGYKRQLMNVLHIMHLYNKIKDNKNIDMVPRTFIFSAKAAAGYYFAKRVIKLINSVARVINNDQSINDLLKVVFLEDYSVSLAEKIIPAADISEQISTASKEASGTGNMKFMMNGALTIGTMDGANIEIHDLVGEDNIFIFGLSAEEVQNYYNHGGYSARNIYNEDPRLKRVLDQLVEPGVFAETPDEFNFIFQSLLNNNDEYFVLKDFDDYASTQKKVDQTYRDQTEWLKKCIINIAHSGNFSSDGTIAKYASDIWNIKPVKFN
ncbi:MAG: glycogen/starch/alpha-glucan phosphorylase [Bacillota bacterium]